MAFEDLEAHLLALGIAPLGAAFEPVGADTWQAIEAASGGAFPDVARWLFTRFGGCQFPAGAYYPDPRARSAVMLGWFLGAAELAKAFDDTRGSMPDDVAPLANDGGDNFVSVALGGTRAGSVMFYIHDAFTDRNVYRIADTLEDFLRSLRRDT